MGPLIRLLSPRTLRAETSAYSGMHPEPIDGLADIPLVPASSPLPLHVYVEDHPPLPH